MATTRNAFVGVLEPRHFPVLVLGTTGISINVGTQATKTLAALGADKRYVATGATFSVAGTIATLTTVGVAIIDGSTGGTAYLWRGIMALGTTGVAPLNIEGRYLIGSANTAMTIEFSAGVTGVTECVSLDYTTVGVPTITAP